MRFARMCKTQEVSMADKKTEIMRCAKELFAAKGFKDTNVADITKMAGMAAGTFYLYFPSKEKLFMDIFMEENVRLKAAIMETLDTNGNPLPVIQELMQRNVAGITANPILREWYNRDVFSRIEQKYREENGLERFDFMYQSFIEVVQKWQTEGKIRNDIPVDMIMALFGAIIVVDTHKEEIGLQYFPKIQEYLVQFVLAGLKPDKQQEEE
jgi:AcrR family transcriptional regulator